MLTINAARAQGVSGLLQAGGAVETKDLSITSDLGLGHVVAVSLDDQPLATSGRILLQEEIKLQPTTVYYLISR